MRALHTAATGMMAQELNVQVISNNIANMRTTGYKRQRAEFQDLLYEHVSRRPRPRATSCRSASNSAAVCAPSAPRG
jgi:flagellar hook-basal body protein